MLYEKRKDAISDSIDITEKEERLDIVSVTSMSSLLRGQLKFSDE